MSRARAICGHEMRLLGADPYPVLLLIAMPLVAIAFLSEGLVGGPGQAVPGLMILFAFLGLYNIGLAFFRDHGWRTWLRLRTLPVATSELVVGKSLPLIALYLLQSAVLLTAGYFLFDMPLTGSPAALAVAVVAVVASLYALGLMLVSLCRTMNQVTAASNVGGLLLAGMGGALTPVELLPSWAERIAPASPVYWALEALRGVLVDGDTVAELATPLLVLVAITVGALAVALTRFDAAETKEYYA